MADYIYLLENRLSGAQKDALLAVRELARAKGLTLFLVGGAVRDLTSGSPVRDLDVVVQGNGLKLRKDAEALGAVVTGTVEAGQALFLRWPGSVRMELGSTLSVTYPKPGKPVLKPATILDDLRRRDFTANAMALSLNEGSYGLLMDPLNGVADIENRQLRLVSNYGFIEDPVRMIRGTRFAARLGWAFEEKTQTRYERGKTEGYIGTLGAFARGYEAEEIVHEEDPLRVMRRLEAEGWMQVLAPAWTSAKANLAELEKVRESQTRLQLQGIYPDVSAVNFPLLTAKMNAKDVEELKKSFPRQGFVAEIEALERQGKEFAAQLGGKGAASASESYRLITASMPEAVLYVAYSTKNAALVAKFKSFFGEWQEARQKIPYALMQEMRIVPGLEGYGDLVQKLFLELMDGKLATAEEMRAFLEPFSPPAPPPPVHLRRSRAGKKDAKGKSRGKKGAAAAEEDDAELDAEEPENAGSDADEEEEGVDDPGYGGVVELAGDPGAFRHAAPAAGVDEIEEEDGEGEGGRPMAAESTRAVEPQIVISAPAASAPEPEAETEPASGTGLEQAGDAEPANAEKPVLGKKRKDGSAAQAGKAVAVAARGAVAPAKDRSGTKGGTALTVSEEKPSESPKAASQKRNGKTAKVVEEKTAAAKKMVAAKGTGAKTPGVKAVSAKAAAAERARGGAGSGAAQPAKAEKVSKPSGAAGKREAVAATKPKARAKK